MKKLLTVVLICAMTLLLSGCGTAGFSLGLAYNEWGATITFNGYTPTLPGTPKTDADPIPQKRTSD